MLQKARIAKKIAPHQLRHTDATNFLNAGAERVDIQVLLGHATSNTTPTDTPVGPERMEKGGTEVVRMQPAMTKNGP
jgi:integrase/recombinase XerD